MLLYHTNEYLTEVGSELVTKRGWEGGIST
jgi:hypothetical protein